ncbi:MAG TPA: diacylglycerol kinase family lipid kinase [Candidatus Coprenecus stercoravium]|uniref:Diacylglycerol kinase family lipid kinase n=1 Tax=Candidatus Coprenecus stercoravium TaxID=2840735 RepID=A0A9D2KA69_9BACT|nr:diacylglycerol kinase family lipid kinase [Candidatus Coprenecus stercoravium]
MNDNIWMAVVNPNAGGGKVASEWPLLSNKLKDRGVGFEEAFTTHRYHAVELVFYALKRGFRKFISVGGDGTLHEIVNGLFYQKDVPVEEITLAVLPAGSANDWSRMFCMPEDYDKAIDTIKECRTVLQDVGRMEYTQAGVRNTRYMVNIAGVGLDANICHYCNIAKNKGRAGKRAYVKAAFRALVGRRSVMAKVVVDGKSFFTGKMFSVGFGIGKYSGGGMMQVPDAVADDGLINLMVARKVSKLKFIAMFPRLFKGTIYKVKEVSHKVVRKVCVITRKPDRVEIDGEVVGTTPLTLEVVPSALRVVVGRDYRSCSRI